LVCLSGCKLSAEVFYSIAAAVAVIVVVVVVVVVVVAVLLVEPQFGPDNIAAVVGY
jgi:Na+/glutamate symporter